MFSLWNRKTPKEILRQNQRSLAKAGRDLDREKGKLEQQERKLVADIKKTAKLGQVGACKIMALDLIRTRKYVQKFNTMKATIQAVELQIQTFSSNQQMAESMKGVAGALKSMNKSAKLPQMQKIMMDFERESEIMEMKQDVMDDALDEVGEDEQEESEEIVAAILDEIGIDLNQNMANVPVHKQPANVSSKEEDLQARLNSLRQ